MNKNNFIQVLLFLALPLSLFAQPTPIGDEPDEQAVRDKVATESEQRLVIDCSVFMEEGYSYYAEIIADRLLEFNADKPNYNFRKGALMLDAHRNQQEAIPYLKKALKKIDVNAEMYSSKEEASPVDVYYFLGKAFHLDTELDSAEYYYQKFIDLSPPETDLVALARLGIKQSRVARREINNPKSALVENVGQVINGEFADFSPVTSLDGSALYFTSRRPWEDNETEPYRDARFNDYPEDIYVSYIDFDGTWIDPFRLDFCDTVRHEATMAVSADERRIYVYQDDSVANGDIFYSDFSTNRFQEIQDLGDDRINTEYWEPHAMVSADGLTMYFSSDRPGGFGGVDIYRVVKLPDNSWSDPINLGPTINTPYNEDAPFIAIDNKTLYFSSNGPLSMGDYDIFVARKIDNETWSSPINLGYPLNSTADDIYYTTTVDGLRGFLSSDRSSWADTVNYGEKDIYEIKNDYMGLNAIAVLKGLILTEGDMPLPEDVAVDLTCLDCADNTPRTIYPRLRDGAYFSSLDPCHEYQLRYHYNDGETEIHRETVKTSCSDAYDEIYRDVLIRIAPDGEIVRVDQPLKLTGDVKMENGDPVPDDVIVELICEDCDDTTPKRLPLSAKKKFAEPLDSCHLYTLRARHENSMQLMYKNQFELKCGTGEPLSDVYRLILLNEPKPQSKLIADVTMENGEDVSENVVVDLVCTDCEDRNPIRMALNPDAVKGMKQKNLEYPLEDCHNYRLYSHYEGDDEELSSSEFGTKCDGTVETIERHIVIPAPIVVKSTKTRLVGDVKTEQGDPLPTDVVVELTCLDCEDQEPVSLLKKRIKDGTEKLEFDYKLEPCHKYLLVCLYDQRKVEAYRNNFSTTCEEGADEEIERHIVIDLGNVVDLPQANPTGYKNPRFKHYFEYNKNKLNPKRGSFNEFIELIEEQMEKGRPNMAITIYSSASNVPTDMYKTNENLTKIRAENIKYDLVTYFQENTDYSDKLTITIVDAKVDGPEYVGDFRKRKKYRPFQYVAVETE